MVMTAATRGACGLANCAAGIGDGLPRDPACPPSAAASGSPGRAIVRPRPDFTDPGQESVWTFPRPAIAQATEARIQIEHRGPIIADTRAAIRTLETSHPPTYYIPLIDIVPDTPRRATGSSFCEWKGTATDWDAVVGDVMLPRVGWSYASPTPAFVALRDHIAFYAALFDRCSVDGETVILQPGGFHGGWITSRMAGPFKGIPGSRQW